MTWRARIVEPDGTVLVGNLDGVTVNSVKLALNQPRTASLTVATRAAGLDQLESDDGTTVNEIQVFRGADLVVWGVPVSIEYGPETTSIDIADPLWLLTRRVIGDLEEVNMLDNPSFEGGTYTSGGLTIPNEWTNSDLEDTDVGFSVNALDGSNIVALITDTGGINRSLYQDVAVTYTEATVLMGTIYCWIEPLVGFDNTVEGDANYELGLVVRRYNGATQEDVQWFKLNESTDRYGWTRYSVPLNVPAGSWTIRFELHPAVVSGKVYFDAARLVEVKRLSFLGTDQAAIAEALVEHAQDPTLNKADLGIATNCPATGVYRNRIYPFAEPTTIYEALLDLADMEDGFDFEVICTEAGKTFRTYAAQGNGVTGNFQWGNNILDWTAGSGLGQAAGSVAVFGEGSTDAAGRADDRERQWVADLSAHSGRMLEVVEMGTVRVNVSELLDTARGVLAARRNPRTLSLTVRDPNIDWVDKVVDRTFGIGDEANVVIDHGPVQINERYRVVEIEIDPVTDTITPVLELAEVWS